MLAFKYISIHYVKYFIIILTALTMFLVGVDYLENADDLSESANLLFIYFVYTIFYAIDMLTPLSLVFAMIATKVFLIRSNALVSFYSLGYSKIDILKPFLVVSTVIIIIFISLHAIPKFARSAEYASNIRNNREYLNPVKDMFFTHNDKFVYFSKMIPVENAAEGIRIFSMKNSLLNEVLIASRAEFKNNFWYIKDANIIKKPIDMSFKSLGIITEEKDNIKILEGFRPKMLDQVYEGKVNYTIGDAISALLLLSNEEINTSLVRGALYKIILYPFFVPSLIVIMFFFVPISSRFTNIYLLSFLAIISTLLIWGTFFMLIELTNNKTITSEIGIVIPTLLLLIIAITRYRNFSKAQYKEVNSKKIRC